MKKELRIGNYISDVHSKTGEWKVVSIGEAKCSYGNYPSHIYTSKYEHLRPIPLSPEVLEACGFEKNLLEENHPEEGHYYDFKLCGDRYSDLGFISGDKNGMFEVCLFPYETWFRYRYLHQLQNAYFALTGEELNYSPKP